MPLSTVSSYRPPIWLRNGHANTIAGGKLRRVERSDYERERIATPDDDFLDLDWLRSGSRRLAIISHGLEGSADRCYVRGMAHAMVSGGWDVLAWNFRSCSGEPNRKLYSYHSGATADLDTVILHAMEGYDAIALIGFSLGGNLTLKYLGERSVRPIVKAAVALSAPCDLAASAVQLARPVNRLYMSYFLRSLRAKIRDKTAMFPGLVDDDDWGTVRTFRDFDDRYTGPMNGFRDAEDYWSKCSGAQFIGAIRTPTLLINAADDPFLGGGCYPEDAARDSTYLTLEMPRYGGHVGYAGRSRDRIRSRDHIRSRDGTGSRSDLYWSEDRTLTFINDSLEWEAV